MSEPKQLHSVHADIERDSAGQSARTGRVALRALPSWLKQQTFISAPLTPKQARRLAMDLLVAAEKAEEGSL